MRLLKIAALFALASIGRGALGATDLCPSTTLDTQSLTSGTYTGDSCTISSASSTLTLSTAADIAVLVTGGTVNSYVLEFVFGSTGIVTAAITNVEFTTGQLKISGAVTKAGSTLTISGCQFLSPTTSGAYGTLMDMSWTSFANAELKLTDNEIAVLASGVSLAGLVTDSDVIIQNNAFVFSKTGAGSDVGVKAILDTWNNVAINMDHNTFSSITNAKSKQGAWLVRNPCAGIGCNEGKLTFAATNNTFSAVFSEFFFTYEDQLFVSDVSFKNNKFECASVSSVSQASIYVQQAALDGSLFVNISSNEIEACDNVIAHKFAVMVPNLPNTNKAQVSIDSNTISIATVDQGPIIPLTIARQHFRIGNNARMSCSNNIVDTSIAFAAGDTHFVEFTNQYSVTEATNLPIPSDMRGKIRLCGNSFGTFKPDTAATVASFVKYNTVLPPLGNPADCNKPDQFSGAGGRVVGAMAMVVLALFTGALTIL